MIVTSGTSHAFHRHLDCINKEGWSILEPKLGHNLPQTYHGSNSHRRHYSLYYSLYMSMGAIGSQSHVLKLGHFGVL